MFDFSKKITRTTSDSGTGTITTLDIEAIGDTLLFKGDEIFFYSSPNRLHRGVLDADVSATDTRITLKSSPETDKLHADTLLPKETQIFVYQKEIIKKAVAQYDSAHQHLYLTSGTNGNDYLMAYGTWNYSVNAATQLSDGNSKPNRWASQFGIYTATDAGSVDRILGYFSTNSGTGDDAVVSVWSAIPNAGSSTNLTINLINATTLTSQNNQNYIHQIDVTPNHNLVEGEIIFVSIKRTGTKASGVKWYGDLEVKVKYNK